MQPTDIRGSKETKIRANEPGPQTTYPHSPDVLERETADSGFSKGWGMHFVPTARYYVNIHGHIQFDDLGKADDAVRTYLNKVKPLHIKRTVACAPTMSRESDRNIPQGFNVFCMTRREELAPYFSLARRHEGLHIMLFLHFRNPDTELIKWSIEQGACAVKLHNAPIIVGAADPGIWLGDEWAAAFEVIEKAGLPVLWHVTQRLTSSPYTGGGANSYWKEGWKKGVSYTNETLLKIYLEIVERYPGIPFLSAHQLHIGWERLDALMNRHPNLHIDTSIGCYVREGDRLYDDDRDFIRAFFIAHSDRILFGSDYSLTDQIGQVTEEENHIRFIRQLRLPDAELQHISHGNAERALGLPQSE